MTRYSIKFDPVSAITVMFAPGTRIPNREPDFPEFDLGPNSSDWVDRLTHRFAKHVVALPDREIVADIAKNGLMRAWIEPPK